MDAAVDVGEHGHAQGALHFRLRRCEAVARREVVRLRRIVFLVRWFVGSLVRWIVDSWIHGFMKQSLNSWIDWMIDRSNSSRTHVGRVEAAVARLGGAGPIVLHL